MVTPFESSFSYTQDITFDNAGNIFLTGMVMGPDATTKIGVAKYKANGALDPTFGNGGKLIYGYRGNNDYGIGIALQADGKIVIGGHSYYTSIPVLQYDIIAVRLNSNGTVDTTYGTNGVAVVTIAAQNYTTRMIMQPDEKIVIAGNLISNTDYNAVFLRIDKDGKPDTTFNTNGYFKIDMGTDKAVEGTTAAIQPDGKVIAAGQYYVKSSGEMTMFAKRYVDANLATTEVQKNQITVYPNPVADVNVNLNGFAAQADLQIINAAGQIVKTEKIGTSQKVNVSNLAPGSYILKLTSKDTSSSVKIIKK